MLARVCVIFVNITALDSKELRPTGIWRLVVWSIIDNIPVEPPISDFRIR